MEFTWPKKILKKVKISSFFETKRKKIKAIYPTRPSKALQLRNMGENQKHPFDPLNWCSSFFNFWKTWMKPKLCYIEENADKL